jgi:hypothetical protein
MATIAGREVFSYSSNERKYLGIFLSSLWKGNRKPQQRSLALPNLEIDREERSRVRCAPLITSYFFRFLHKVKTT